MKILALAVIAGICLLGVVGFCCAQDWSNERGHELRAPLVGDQRLAQAKKEGKSSRRLTKEQEKLADQLEKAADKGDLARVKSLLDRGAPPDGSVWTETPLCSACVNGHMAVVRLLVERGANMDSCGWSGTTPLYWAAYRSDKEMVQYLLDRGARDIDSGLWGAAVVGSEEMVQFFLDKGARKLDLPLSAASGRGDVKMMGFFLQRGARATGDTLTSAASGGHVPAIKRVLQLGVDVNDKNQRDGETALMWAAKSCRLAATEFLLQQGADINAQNNKAITALGYARKKAEDPDSKDRTECKAVVDLLRKHGARDDSLAGEWSGTVYQIGPGEKTSGYPAKMILNGDSGSMDYHTLQCGGRLTFLNKKGNVYYFRESLTYGRNKCIDDGIVAVEPGENSVQWAWNGSGVSVSGQLVGSRR